MELTTQELVHLVGRAQYFEERLVQPFPGTHLHNDTDTVAALLSQWREVLGDTDNTLLEKRLAWDGLDLPQVCQILADETGTTGSVTTEPAPTESVEFPSWATLLQEILRHLPFPIHPPVPSSVHSSVPFDPLHPPVPFEHLWRHIVLFASQEVQRLCPQGWLLLEPPARASLQTALLQLLAKVGNLTLQLEFSFFRVHHQPVWHIVPRSVPDEPRTLYQQFIQELLAGSFLSLLKEYSVLARLLAQVTEDWITSSCMFLQRLSTDWPQICQTFNLASQCRVTLLSPYLSDLHHHGQTVIALQLAEGMKLIYKPRDMGMEKAYYNMLAWWNRKIPDTPFLCLSVLNCGSHGWMECALPRQCSDENEVRHYYYRAGMILCLLHLLRGRDFHVENIIAAGPQPVLVDLESLFHADLTETAQLTPGTPHPLSDSVLRTDFLPQLAFDFYAMDFDVSGLGSAPGQDTPYRVPRWTQINSDAMEIQYTPFVLGSYLNRPLLQNLPVTPRNHVEVVVSGFKTMAHLVHTWKTEFLAQTGPFVLFETLISRFLFRPSKVYGALLYQCVKPHHLRQGLTLSIQLERLYKKALLHGHRPPWWPLVQVEKEAVARLCVPHFTVAANSVQVTSAALTFAPGLQEPAYNTARERLRIGNETDWEAQVSIIRESLGSDFHQHTTGLEFIKKNSNHLSMEVIP